ncbi:MAG: hypothetical protein AcusKO_50750 [Acuticoccus sp.]
MQAIWSIIERVFGVFAVIALFALVALPFTQVVMRDAFNAPVAGLEEATRWGLIALVYLALPLLISTNEQIRFSEIVDRLPKAMRHLLERLHLLVGAAALVVLVDAAIGSALQNATNRTPMLNLPFKVFIAPMVIGLAVTAIGAFYFGLRRSAPPIDPPGGDFIDREPKL